MAIGFSEKESRGWDSTVEALSYMALLSAGAYAGVKHFPSITMKRAMNRMSSHLRGARGRTANLTGNFHRTFGTQQIPSPLWKTARPQDLTLLHEMQTAINVFKSESRISGAGVDAVSRSLMSRYAADVPQAAGSMNPMTVRQLFRGTGMSELRAHVGEEAVDQLKDSIQHLVRLPGFRQSLARQGLTEAQFLGRVPVGAFMGVSGRGREVMSVRGGLRALLEDVADVRIPFTQFKPFSLLIPNLTPKPGTTFLGGKAARAMFGAQDALFIDGVVHPLRAEGRELLMGRAEVGYRLATTRQVGAARAAAARMGLLRPTYGEGRAERLARTRQQPRWRRQLNILSRRAGVGPQWAGRRSVAENVYGRLRAIATGAKPKYLRPAGAPAAGITPEGAWLRELTKRPSSAVMGMADLSLSERIRLRLGSRIGRAFYEDGKFIRHEVARLPGVRRSAKSMPDPFGRGIEYYASQGRGVSDWLNHQLTRPLWMMAEMTGLGMKPGRSPLESLGQIGLKLAAPAYIGYQALEYAEYKTNRWLGFGPITGPAALYTQARVGAQHVLDAAGVTGFMQDMEEQYPGSIESPVSRGLRGAGTVLGSMFLASRAAHPYAKYAAMAGGSVLGWLQLAGINKPADELTKIYSGEQDLPVRASRGWILGRTLYSGGKIKYYEPSWYHRLQTRPKEIGMYGSRQAARHGSWLPTPENWFLARNLLDPYELERSHHYDRPYPETGGLGAGVPIVGPIVSNTIGRLIKPIQRRAMPVGAETSTPATNDYEQAIALGLGGPVARTEGRVASRLELLTGDTIYRVFDWTGLPGFMIGAIREQLTGKTGWYLDQKAMATSSAMTSPSRDWYDRNLGGAGGLTEGLRRFFPKDQNRLRDNPLANRTPRWLPGTSSVFKGDRENFINFSEGDPFTAIEKGEMRLPGAGWDAVHKGVENKTPGMYSSLERLQILGDVSPHSQAYKHYRKMVEGQIALGTLKKQDIGRFVQIQDQVAEQMKSRVGTGGYRYGFGEFREQEVTIEDTGLTTFTTHQHPGMQFHLAGVEGRTYALEGSHDRFGKLRRRMAELRGKTLPMVYGGFGPTTPAILGDANEWAIDAGLGKTRPVSDLDFRAKHGSNMFRHSYEWLMHTTLPGPLNWPRAKWMGQMAPVEEYEAFTERGSLDTGWEHPVQNYITPWFNQFFGSTSSAQLETRRINEYADHFKFAKYSRLQARAEAMGDMGMANQFSREAGQTLVAADPMAPSFYRDVFGALPPSERPYFAAFAGVTSEARQERILRAVPENLKPTYIGVWERQAGTAGFDSPVLQRYAEEAKAHYETRPGERVAQYFAHQPLPEASYAAWNPGVDLDTIRIKMAEDEALDIHEMRMWEPQRIEAAGFAFGAPARQPEMDREELLELLRRHGYSNARSVQGFPGNSNKFRFRRSRMSRWQQVHDNMALQGAS